MRDPGLTISAAGMPKSSWPLLIVVGVVILLVTVILVAQLTDPDRQRRTEERRILVGDAWRPRNVVLQLPLELSHVDERDSRENVDGGGEPADPVLTSDDELAARRDRQQKRETWAWRATLGSPRSG